MLSCPRLARGHPGIKETVLPSFFSASEFCVTLWLVNLPRISISNRLWLATFCVRFTQMSTLMQLQTLTAILHSFCHWNRGRDRIDWFSWKRIGCFLLTFQVSSICFKTKNKHHQQLYCAAWWSSRIFGAKGFPSHEGGLALKSAQTLFSLCSMN